MKLRRAISLDQYLKDEEDFGGREEREERRSRRKSRRRRRRGKKPSRRAKRSRGKADRLEQSDSRQRRPTRRRRRREEEREETALVRVPQGQPSPSPSEPWQQAEAPAWPEDLPEAPLEPIQETWTDQELPFDDEVMGYALPRLRRNRQQTNQSQAGSQHDRWSPPARMGTHLRIQAQAGHRAAVVELKPGLYLVAQVPEQATRPEIGLAPLLAPLMVKAARRIMANRKARQAQAQQQGQTAQPQGKGILAMFRHPQPGQPGQPGQPQPAQPQLVQVQPTQPVAQIPGPIATPGQAWATVPGPQGQPMLVQLPQPVQWDTDDEQLSGLVTLVPFRG